MVTWGGAGVLQGGQKGKGVGRQTLKNTQKKREDHAHQLGEKHNRGGGRNSKRREISLPLRSTWAYGVRKVDEIGPWGEGGGTVGRKTRR